MTDQPSSIRWIPLPREAAIAAEATEPLLPQARALFEAGVPLVAGGGTAKEQAIALLEIAAEVEHALMVQYLYLAMSIDGTDHDTVLKIAIEEMAHLATVENLLILLGGPGAIYLQRDIRRRTSQLNPIPFVLEPLSRSALAKYIAAESPATLPAELSDKVEELVALAKAESGVEPNRVGAIYAMLEWIFSDPEAARSMIDLGALLPAGALPDPPHLASEDLQPDTLVAAHEMLPEEWGDDRDDYLVETPRTLEAAVAAIAKVGAQGEGAESGMESHFLRFMALVDRFDAGQVPMIAMPTSPKVDGNGGERPTALSDPYAQLWGRAFNAQYGLIVFGIHFAARLSRTDAAQAALRESVAGLTMRGMRTVLLPVARVMSNLPEPITGSTAGPPFELEPTIIHTNDSDLGAAWLRLLDGASELYAAIEAHPDHLAVGDPANRLAQMKRLDAKRREAITS